MDAKDVLVHKICTEENRTHFTQGHAKEGSCWNMLVRSVSAALKSESFADLLATVSLYTFLVYFTIAYKIAFSLAFTVPV